MSTHTLHLRMDISGHPVDVGQVWLREEGRHESASFAYSQSYLQHPLAYAIEPALPLREETFQTKPGQRIFGCMADAAPDRWGRALLAEHAGAGRALSEAQVLSQGLDELRMGALRIFDPDSDTYLAYNGVIPQWKGLPALMKAAYNMTQPAHEKETVDKLWQAGSTMGGANPKAMTRGDDGALWLAKFSSSTDIIDMIRWEALCLELAAKAGIETPQFHLKQLSGGAALLVRRFDRDEQGNRIGFISGHTLVGAIDGSDYHYSDLRDGMIEHGADPAADLPRLWQRMVFNLAVSNQDDHLRNHGLLQTNGWRLSPAYDITPTPPRYRKPQHALPIGVDGEGDNGFAHAMAVAGSYELTPTQATQILEKIGDALSDWEQRALQLGIPQRQVSLMADSIGVRMGGSRRSLRQ